MEANDGRDMYDAVFHAWKQQPQGVRTYTDFNLLEVLRQSNHGAYQNHHVTRTAPSKCDLMGFARAGYAGATSKNEKLREATRVYRLPPSRLDDSMGSLEDVENFGFWDYRWDGHDFVVLQVTYQDDFHSIIHLLYVLSQIDDSTKTTQHDAKTDALLLAAGQWTRELHQEIWVYDNAQWIKNKSLWKSVQDASWDDVILDPQMKAKLLHDVDGFFDSRATYQKLKIPWKRGIIFHGVPGNGKTVSIKAIMGRLARRSPPVQSLYVKSLDACSGPKWSVQQIFQKARRIAPCLLVFEDLDSLVGDRTRSYFLNEVDGLESNEGIAIIGSTNHLDRLDPAVTKRPSRFDRKYHFSLPCEDERLAYCRYWREKFTPDDQVHDFFPDAICPIIAHWTEGYSFAFLKELFVTSLLMHARGGAHDDDVTPDSVDIPNKAGTSGNGDETKEKKVLPVVEIPETLQGNSLLRIVKAQARLLLEEMDHASNDNALHKVSGADGPAPIRLPYTNPIDEGDDE